MHVARKRYLSALALVGALGIIGAACGGDDADDDAAATTGAGEAVQAGKEAPANLSGTIRADGSSTVAPLMKVTAEDFQAKNKGVTVTVGTSGTGGGFEKFCNGESDIANASRPIKSEETAKCQAKGIDYFEFLVANDALTVVVNKDNTWAECLTVEQLKKVWEPSSTVNNWNQIDPSFPDQKLSLFGPGTDSGTFDYFTEEINGKSKASRTDYSPSEDDNVIVRGVEGDKGAMGYFGLSYYEENASRLKALKIDGGGGCVEGTKETVQDGTYTPLGRPLFIYVSKAAAARPEVKAFVEFYEENSDEITEEALFVPLTDEQKSKVAEQIRQFA